MLNGQPIRLSGFDAPEAGQTCGDGTPCGAIATAALERLIALGDLYCAPDGTTTHDRIVAICRVSDQIELGSWMVANGYAVDDARYAPDYSYEMAMARDAQAGLWRHGLQSGRAHRYGTALVGVECSIKGNISRSGRIYHVPGVSPWYGNTRIDLSRGERMFCTVAEAEAAGFRAPRG